MRNVYNAERVLAGYLPPREILVSAAIFPAREPNGPSKEKPVFQNRARPVQVLLFRERRLQKFRRRGPVAPPRPRPGRDPGHGIREPHCLRTTSIAFIKRGRML